MTHHNVHIGGHFSVDGKSMAIAPTIGVGQYDKGVVGVTVTLLADDVTLDTHTMSDQTTVVANRDLFGHEKLDEIVSFLTTWRAQLWLRHLEETKDYPRTPSNDTVDLIDELLDMVGETTNLDVPGGEDEPQVETWSGDIVPVTRAHRVVLDVDSVSFVGRGDDPNHVKQYVKANEVTAVDIDIVRDVNRVFAADDGVNPVSVTDGGVNYHVSVTTLTGYYSVEVNQWVFANGVDDLPYPVAVNDEYVYNDIHTLKTRDEVAKDNNKRNGVDT